MRHFSHEESNCPCIPRVNPSQRYISIMGFMLSVELLTGCLKLNIEPSQVKLPLYQTVALLDFIQSASERASIRQSQGYIALNTLSHPAEDAIEMWEKGRSGKRFDSYQGCLD